jgi:hypothetical protein
MRHGIRAGATKIPRGEFWLPAERLNPSIPHYYSGEQESMENDGFAAAVIGNILRLALLDSWSLRYEYRNQRPVATSILLYTFSAMNLRRKDPAL